MSQPLHFTLEDSVVTIYVVASGQPVMLGQISVDSESAVMEQFMQDMGKLAQAYLPSWTASDIFTPRGTVRGVSLVGSHGARRWVCNLPGVKTFSIQYDATKLHADVAYIAHRIGRVFGFDEDTFTFQIVNHALKSITKPI